MIFLREAQSEMMADPKIKKLIMAEFAVIDTFPDKVNHIIKLTLIKRLKFSWRQLIKTWNQFSQG